MGKMKKEFRRRLIWGFCGAMLFIVGCDSQDSERLSAAARAAVAKVEGLTGGPQGKFLSTWQSLQGGMNDDSLGMRVSSRLHWDKNLAETVIEVHSNGTEVELKGTVRDLAQRRRAVELAESTTGTEKVIDLLEVPEKEQ